DNRRVPAGSLGDEPPDRVDLGHLLRAHDQAVHVHRRARPRGRADLAGLPHVRRRGRGRRDRAAAGHEAPAATGQDGRRRTRPGQAWPEGALLRPRVGPVHDLVHAPDGRRPGRRSGRLTAGMRPQRALILWYSQTGQLRRALEAFVRPLEEAGVELVWEELRPVPPFPFPWSLRAFLDAFPESVLGGGSLAPPT